MKRIKSIILSVAIVLYFFSVPTETVRAKNYDPSAAISYAQENWNSKGNASNDCANFVSDCLSAGGIVISKPTPRELYNALLEKGYESVSLTTEYTKSGLIVPAADNNISIGDPIFAYCSQCDNGNGKYLHVTLAGGIDSKGYITVYAHSEPKNNKRLYADDSNNQQHIASLKLYAIHMQNTVDDATAEDVAFETSGIVAPDNVCIKEGGFWGLRGVITCSDSDTKIRKITGSIANMQTGEIVQCGMYAFTDTSSVDIKATLNNALLFNLLEPGLYNYNVEVQTDSGIAKTVISTEFEVVQAKK